MLRLLAKIIVTLYFVDKYNYIITLMFSKSKYIVFFCLPHDFGKIFDTIMEKSSYSPNNNSNEPIKISSTWLAGLL